MSLRVPIDPQHTPPLRRLRTLHVTPELILAWILSLCEKPRTYSAVGMPADARLVSAAYLESERMFALIIESESYEEAPPGSVLHHITVQFTEHFGYRDAEGYDPERRKRV